MTASRTMRRGKGFLVIAAVFLTVVIAGLILYLTTVSTTSQAASAADQNSARAYQAARAGIEWAAYWILDPNSLGSTFKTTCNGGGPADQDLTFASTTTLTAFRTRVRCTSTGDYSEGATTTLRTYTIESNACNAAACPSAAPTSTYVERQLTVTITK